MTLLESPAQSLADSDYLFQVLVSGIPSNGLAGFYAKYTVPSGKTNVTLAVANTTSGQRGDGVYKLKIPAWVITREGVGFYDGFVSGDASSGQIQLGSFNMPFKIVTEIVDPTGYVVTNGDIETLNKSNVVLNRGSEKVVVGTELNVGDELQARPTDKYLIKSGDISGSVFTVSSGGDVASGKFPDTKNPVFNFVTELKPKVVFTLGNSSLQAWQKVTKNGEPTTPTTSFYNGDSLEIEITDPRHTLVSAKLSGGDSELNIPVSNNKGSVILPYTERNYYALILETKSTIAPYEIEKKDIDLFTSKKVKLYINDVLAKAGSLMKAGDSLLFSAEKSVIIQICYFRYGNPSKTNDLKISYPNNEKATGTVAPDFTGVWGVEFKVETKDGSPIPDPDPENPVTINNVYKVNKDIMDVVNKERFKVVLGEGDYSWFDYGQSILSLINLPFSIDPDLIGEDANIVLGSYKLTQSAPTITTELIKVDLGSIKIDGDFNNSKDYIGTVALLHLPRISPINLDLEYVIGQTIGVEYLIDVYTGKATVNIKSSKSGEVIVTKQVDLGFNIPNQNLETQSAENSNIELGGDNGVTKPFIELVKSDLILSDGFYTIPMPDEGILDGRTGYIEVEHVELKTLSNSRERDLLESKLKEGIIIK